MWNLLIPNIVSGLFTTAKEVVVESISHKRDMTSERRMLDIERIRAEREAQAELAKERIAIADADMQSVRNQKHSLADETLRIILAVLLGYIVLDPIGARETLKTLDMLPLWLMLIYILAVVDILGVRSVFTSIGDWLSRNRNK